MYVLCKHIILKDQIFDLHKNCTCSVAQINNGWFYNLIISLHLIKLQHFLHSHLRLKCFSLYKSKYTDNCLLYTSDAADE